MLKSYLVITLRTLRRNKVFSFINVVGLAIGLTACFLIWQYVRFELSFDKFHANAKRLYRVPSELLRHDTHIGTIAANAPAVGPAMKADFPEVEEYTRLVKTSLFTGNLTSYFANSLEFSYQHPGGDLVAFNEERVYFSDAPLLTMFDFPLIAGKNDALKEPNSVVLTESIAHKYFGDEPALGKEMRLNHEMVLKVTGVLKDIPENCHLQFDILISFSTMMNEFGDGANFWQWSVFYSYLLLSPEANPDALEAKFPAFTKKYLGESNESEYRMRYFLQPITDIHLRSQFDEEQSANGDERTVYFLSILAVFILVIAWINYINLSTAKALERSKEVGLRKVVGAKRKQLVTQFLFDAAVINFLAVLVAAVLVVVAWHPFEELVGKKMASVLFRDGLIGGIGPWVAIVLVFVLGVLLVGAYPAMVLSAFNPAQVLKGRFFKSPGGTLLRKLMISVQYVLAVLLLAGTVTIYLQISYMRDQDTGFTKDQVVVVEAPAVYDSTAGSKITFFTNAAMQLPNVKQVSASGDVPGRVIIERYPISRINAQPNEAFETFIPSVDTSFFTTYGIPIKEGRIFSDRERMTFRKRDENESIPVVVNEEFVRQLEAKDLKDALKVKMNFWWGPEERRAEIIGVVANHHHLSFKEKVLPIMYIQPEWTGWKYFSLRMGVKNMEQEISILRSIYTGAFHGTPFTYFFLDEFYDRQYHSDQQFGRIFNVFTILAIIVTCLGLLGLSIFSVTQRTKEIGIRKILGSSATGILFLFSKDFLKVLLISYIIATPVIYYAGNQWLQTFSFRIPLRWEIFALPLVLLLTITLITIAGIALKAALSNPVKALRHE